MKVPPHNAAQAFEDGIREASARHAARGDGLPRPLHQTGASPLRFVEPARLDGVAIPPRRWIVDRLVPVGNVTMLSGDGGLGKSLLSQQLLTACAIGRPWIGQPVTRCRTMGIYCEDDGDELHRRQADINEHYGIGFADLGDCCWLSRAGADSILMRFGRSDWGAGKATPLLLQIREAAVSFGARLLVLDSLHDLFLGNENDRGAARGFIGALHGIALAMDGAVLLCAHPSLTGMNSGTGSAGSTAWNNAVRSRLYLTHLKDEDAEDNDTRVLRGMKANYSATGGRIEMRWSNGVFVAKEKPTGVMAMVADRRVEAIFLDCLDRATEQGRTVTDAKNSPRYAPRVFAAMAVAKAARTGRKALERAMEQLFDANKIRMGEARGLDRHTIRTIIRGAPDAAGSPNAGH